MKNNKRKVYNTNGELLGYLKSNTTEFIVVFNDIGLTFDIEMESVKFSGRDLIVSSDKYDIKNVLTIVEVYP